MANEKLVTTEALIAKFQYALDNYWGYIYGAIHEMWSAAKQASYEKAHQGDKDRENSCKYGGKWAGHWVTDCSGLFYWAFKELGGYMYHGSNTMWKKYCTDKGALKAGKRTDGKMLLPGTAVFTGKTESVHNHVGLYAGNGWVIEAQGAINGVTRTKITNSKWTWWGELTGVDYGYSAIPAPDPGTIELPDVYLPNTSEKTTAKVIAASGKWVKMRKEPSTSCSMYDDVPVGAVVTVEEKGDTWSRISYGKRRGWYMMTRFLWFDA